MYCMYECTICLVLKSVCYADFFLSFIPLCAKIACTAMYIAIDYGHYDLLLALFDRGAAIDAVDLVCMHVSFH